MSPQRSGCHSGSIGICMFCFTAETILYSRTMALGALTLLRDSRQVEPTPFLQSRRR